MATHATTHETPDKPPKPDNKPPPEVGAETLQQPFYTYRLAVDPTGEHCYDVGRVDPDQIMDPTAFVVYEQVVDQLDASRMAVHLSCTEPDPKAFKAAREQQLEDQRKAAIQPTGAKAADDDDDDDDKPHRRATRHR